MNFSLCIFVFLLTLSCPLQIVQYVLCYLSCQLDFSTQSYIIMRGVGTILSVLFLLLCIPGSSGLKVSKSPVICSSAELECQNDENNLIDILMHVSSVAECRLLCEDAAGCEFITHFSASASPISSMCMLFSSCESVAECSSCVTQNIDCFQNCSSNTIGHMDQNVVDVELNVQSELDCKRLCSATQGCSWYTYFYRNHSVHHENCFMLTELLPPVESCPSCVSGPSHCSSATAPPQL